ncbi:uncharacterized protein LOC120430300 isoform X1 [Culex pipiens pallens]|uniref:uncharacterized protein LOC120430300 isoform X1 n=1 Tax=Culex pipiens pallens TaxID=42434 RepID=UPI0022AB44A8|nr:uncharacterized protein LOC120430300 isoform X1 [Culex pipiens pallens]XP_052564560.1 uncharacterized protein LOC120430300 isoform X1 [Culex pipiens pallens]XP_052564561.1 uncharacterized protein LOC120430300 isoform X1 [Culex pipiens pallens]XP_052564562.1 uncharacterized protein LOC120430300 isoform X1 [Culex pipiens pallens]XP_052564563.1 uncharacterized protein LOC120430300 isoform X1 [Culex pipiens pallens]XP_052564564.1 uncharacterized protein LOC120430300 isoform X1 [Culex pipiens pa
MNSRIFYHFLADSRASILQPISPTNTTRLRAKLPRPPRDTFSMNSRIFYHFLADSRASILQPISPTNTTRLRAKLPRPPRDTFFNEFQNLLSLSRGFSRVDSSTDLPHEHHATEGQTPKATTRHFFSMNSRIFYHFLADSRASILQPISPTNTTRLRAKLPRPPRDTFFNEFQNLLSLSRGFSRVDSSTDLPHEHHATEGQTPKATTRHFFSMNSRIFYHFLADSRASILQPISPTNTTRLRAKLPRPPRDTFFNEFQNLLSLSRGFSRVDSSTDLPTNTTRLMTWIEKAIESKNVTYLVQARARLLHYRDRLAILLTTERLAEDHEVCSMVVQFCIEDIDDTLGKAKKRSEINTSGEDNSGAADGQNNGTAHVNPDQTERRDEVGTDGNPPGPSSNFLSSTQSGNRGFNMAWNNLLNQNTTPRNPEPSRQPDNLGNDNGDLLNISERLPGYNEHQNGGQGTVNNNRHGTGISTGQSHLGGQANHGLGQPLNSNQTGLQSGQGAGFLGNLADGLLGGQGPGFSGGLSLGRNGAQAGSYGGRATGFHAGLAAGFYGGRTAGLSNGQSTGSYGGQTTGTGGANGSQSTGLFGRPTTGQDGGQADSFRGGAGAGLNNNQGGDPGAGQASSANGDQERVNERNYRWRDELLNWMRMNEQQRQQQMQNEQYQQQQYQQQQFEQQQYQQQQYQQQQRWQFEERRPYKAIHNWPFRVCLANLRGERTLELRYFLLPKLRVISNKIHSLFKDYLSYFPKF